MKDQNPFDHNPTEPNFTLINPDEPDLNPEAWAETKGGTEGIFTGEKRERKRIHFHRRVKANNSHSDTTATPTSTALVPQGGTPYVTKKFLAVTLAIAVVVSSLLGALIGSYMNRGGGSYSNLSSSSLEESTGSKLTIQQIYKKNADAVVEITTEVTTASVLGTSVSEGAGSGVIVNSKGYVATNYHVIEDANKVKVRLRNGKSYSASVVGYDESNDIAVLKISGKKFSAVSIGKSANVQVGDLAVAIGNPLGQLGGTTTSGIISALDRQLTIDNKKLTLLQTDSAINPGNSGGGLFNGNGELIGIVVAKGSGTGIEGLGFAIPIDTAAPIIDDIIKNGTVTEKPAAGMTILDVTDDTKAQYNVDKAGIYINEVYGSNAKKAGLKAGDRITKVNGKSMKASSDVISAIQKKKVGDKVSITVERNGKEKTISFKLEKASKFENRTSSSSQSNGNNGNNGSNGNNGDSQSGNGFN